MHANIPAVDRQVARSDNLPERPALAQGLEAMDELSSFLKETPAVTNQTEAKNGAAFVERSRIAIDAIEKERTAQVGPLNATVAAINGDYRLVREPLERALKRLRGILTDFANAEERKRRAEAERLAAEAAEKERLAREAEAREKDEIARADVGECTDVGGAIAEADQKFSEFQKAGRAAAVAERDVPVRFRSAMGGKTVSMRSRRVLVVSDPHAAVKALWPNERIADAIRLAAKDYENEFEELPPGITETFERSI